MIYSIQSLIFKLFNFLRSAYNLVTGFTMELEKINVSLESEWLEGSRADEISKSVTVTCSK